MNVDSLPTTEKIFLLSVHKTHWEALLHLHWQQLPLSELPPTASLQKILSSYSLLFFSYKLKIMINYLWWILSGSFQKPPVCQHFFTEQWSAEQQELSKFSLILIDTPASATKTSTAAVVTVKYDNGEIILKE